MPSIKTFTAQQGPGTVQAITATPNSFGAQAFEGVAAIGKGFEAITQKIQQDKDQLDLVKLHQQYAIQLDEAKTAIANDPNLDRHGDMLQEVNDKIQERLLKENPDLSSSVQAAFRNHAIKEYTSAAIDLAHQGHAIAVERQIVDLQQRTKSLVDAQAMVPPDQVFSRDTSHVPGQVRGTVGHLIQSFMDNGTIHPAAAEKLVEDLNNRYWEQRATEFPEHVMQVVASGKLGADDFGMDQAKAQHYNAIAVNTLNQRQAQQAKLEKDQEKYVKQIQETNADTILADMIEGKSSAALGPLLRQRGLNSTDAQRLFDFQVKRTQTPNVMNYNPAIAAKTEAYLSVHKYDNKPVDREAWQSIMDDYNAGRISEPEHTRLMALYRDVVNHKQQSGKEGSNQDVTHANANLKHDLRTSGPADKYDALSEQTIVNADQAFWRKMRDNPNADPWTVAKEISGIFKPVIEKRLALSKEDKAALNDAKIQALVQTRALSPAGAKAMREQNQVDEGNRIVQETIKNLPPPPPPGVIDRLFRFVSPTPKSPDNTDFGYGKRQDGTNKGLGYFGEVPRKDGKGFSGELTIGVNIDGKQMEIPSMVPTLTPEELDSLVNDGPLTKTIIDKAVAHAKKRIAEGKSPFAQPGEQTGPTPNARKPVTERGPSGVMQGE